MLGKQVMSAAMRMLVVAFMVFFSMMWHFFAFLLLAGQASPRRPSSWKRPPRPSSLRKIEPPQSVLRPAGR
jgi:hypothetical protein